VVPLAAFPPDVVAAVCRHLNDDHAADLLLIARTLGGLPAAASATAVGIDAESLQVAARLDGRTEQVRIAFAAPASQRSQLRFAVVELHERARREAATTHREHA